MVESAPTSTARLTQDDGAGIPAGVQGAGLVSWDSSRAARLNRARIGRGGEHGVGQRAVG